MENLTKAQRKVFEFIERFIAKRGTSPTYREIQKEFGWASVFGVQRHVRALTQKGFLESNISKIIPSSMHRAGSISIPILGSVPAGIPNEQTEMVEGTLPIPESMASRGHFFALRVRGDSMIGAGILEGDLVIVRQQQTAEPGDIIVALVEGESTVKRLEKKNHTFYLKAENLKYAPIPIQNSKDIVQGKVCGVFRTLKA